MTRELEDLRVKLMAYLEDPVSDGVLMPYELGYYEVVALVNLLGSPPKVVEECESRQPDGVRYICEKALGHTGKHGAFLSDRHMKEEW